MMEKKTFCDWVYDGSPMLKVLSWFYTQGDLDHDKSTIVRCARIDRLNLRSMLPILEETGIIEFTRRIGTSKMYRTAKSSSEVSDIIRKNCKFVWLP